MSASPTTRASLRAGKPAPWEVLSETVVKVTVPKGVATVEERPCFAWLYDRLGMIAPEPLLTIDGVKKFVEIKAATAGGVSNPIRVPVLLSPVTPAKPTISFNTPTLTLAFQYKGLGIRRGRRTEPATAGDPSHAQRCCGAQA